MSRALCSEFGRRESASSCRRSLCEGRSLVCRKAERSLPLLLLLSRYLLALRAGLKETRLQENETRDKGNGRKRTFHSHLLKP